MSSPRSAGLRRRQAAIQRMPGDKVRRVQATMYDRVDNLIRLAAGRDECLRRWLAQPGLRGEAYH